MQIKQKARRTLATLDENRRVHRVRFGRLLQRLEMLPPVDSVEFLAKDCRRRIRQADEIGAVLAEAVEHLEAMEEPDVPFAMQAVEQFFKTDEQWTDRADRLEAILDEIERKHP